MSGSKITAYYFDACVYLACLRNEESHYGKPRIQAIKAVWQQSERGGVAVVTSALTITEVLSHKLNAKAEKDFTRTIQSGIHQVEDVTPPIAFRARQYRDYYKAHPVKWPRGNETRSDLTTADAIHLATASILGCDQFWTFDGSSTTIKPTIGILWLGNQVGTDSMIICQPQQAQYDLGV
jgi:predicted nucleic acid-binding protein